MSVLDRIEKTQIRDLLGKGWLMHDGLSFFQTCRAFGIDQVKTLNRAAINSLAPIETERAKQVLEIGLIDQYCCGVIYRVECWLEALGVRYSMQQRSMPFS